MKFIHSTFAKYNKVEDIENDTDLPVPPSKDRSKIIPVDISIKYLKSSGT